MTLRRPRRLFRCDIGPWFTAQFDSTCDSFFSSSCSGEVEEGEQARYVDGEVVCEACGDEAENPSDKSVIAEKVTICSQCHYELAVTEQRLGLTRHKECS